MTTKNEEIYHSILLDDREPIQLAIEMEKYGHEVEVKRLKTGDFEGKTSIGEIKRGDDFFASIVDRRLINQAKKMHQTGKERFLILAGNMSDERFRMKPVLGTMLEMVFRYEIAIIPVMNVEATIAYAIHCILTKVDGKKPPSVNYTQTRNYTTGLDRNTNREMFQSIPGIGPKRAFAIESSEFNTIEKLVNASRAQLASIPRVGKISAETIYNALRGKPPVVNKRSGMS